MNFYYCFCEYLFIPVIIYKTAFKKFTGITLSEYKKQFKSKKESTLEYLIEDYFDHLEHHIKQIINY